MQIPTLIYEFANVHGGDVAAVRSLTEALGKVGYPRAGVKFHPISAETLALPDFSYYGIYQQVQIGHADWTALIAEAHEKVGSVWIECADLSAFQVLEANLPQIAGLKLQSSVLVNDEVLSALRSIDLREKTLILNVSGHDLGELQELVARFGGLGAGRLALQIGFQAYPTRVDDTSLDKLLVLRAAFPGVLLSMSDHMEGSDPFARRLPLLAAALGCEIIEKHVALDRTSAPYDGSAALEPTEIAEMARDLELTARAFSGRFVVPLEAAYLAKTKPRPIAREHLPAGSMVAPSTLIFRRTDKVGITVDEVEALQTSRHVLARDVPRNAPLVRDDFRKARIGAIVAGRMKSTRLRDKAILPVAGRSSIERCLENCLLMQDVDLTVLATSTHERDGVLASHTLDGKVGFWRGEEDDVIRRYLGAANKFGIDVIVRVTADCLTISPEVTSILLDAHFRNGADFTRARTEAPGSAPQIFNVEVLRRIDRLTGGAPFSEYMNQYVENNPELFRIQWVDLPPDLVRDYRLTLDYPEDLAMYEALYRELDAQGLSALLRNVFAVLDKRPDIAALNASRQMVYVANNVLVEQLKRDTRIVPAKA
ncbi:N-acetylneuraminate synthase family protein [Sediminicoccus rosea]|uniref:N-acetylneuraminate synthase family protein n=1 Tax=Sediminicoccus rosea TaxID=1225128 RepID=A0ABZ0PP00_9PROT|nr:N-acetylneuraminate synthase family protein [Sediminicoccus rosea]WPB87450.1 N-acetylneuraminate synthase family protein [Sediminicoccus rosea]